jgi:integrase
MPRLTKREVDKLRPGVDEAHVWDSELKGFGVRMMPTGVGTYILKYRNEHHRQRKLALARLTEITPDEARKLARQKLAEIAKGGDPSAERRAQRKAVTISELCELYLEDAKPRVKSSTWIMDRSRIESHVKPLIGRQVVAGLSREDIERFQADVAAGKSAKPRRGRGGVTTGGNGAAARSLGMLNTILEFAKRRKIIRENHARAVRKLPEGRRRRFLSIEEIGALGVALREAKAESPTALAAIRLLLLTGARRGEVLTLPWAWVDIRAHCIRFGDTKSGAQVRPLGCPAMELLTSLPRKEDCPFVFPAGRGDGHFVGLPRTLARLCRIAGIEGITVHTLRHSFAATAAEMGYSELTIAGLLGHAVPGVTARYAHVPDSALLSAADRVAARLSAILDGRDASSSVVQLRSTG